MKDNLTIINKFKRFKDTLEKTIYDSTVEPHNRYTSCVRFVDMFNQLIEEATNINIKDLSTYKLTERNPYNMIWSTQKSIMDDLLLQTDNIIAELETIDENEQKSNEFNKLFISHSSENCEYVKALVNLLEDIGFNKDNLFCSSYSPYNIPLNEIIDDYLRKQFVDYHLHIIFVLSNEYNHSVACQNEVGAAWVLKTKSTLMLLPGFDFADIKGVIKSTEVGIKMDNNDCRERLNELKDKLIAEFGFKQIEESIWERKRDDFINEIRKLSKNSFDK